MSHRLLQAAAWLTLVLTGCGGDMPAPKIEIPKAVQNLPQTVTNAAQAVQATITSELALELAGPLKTTCYASLTSIPGRPTVLQITSYADPAAETFPSVLIWAPVAANAPADLLNQTVQAQMFAQRDANSAPWQTPPGQAVSIKFTALQGSVLVGQIEAGATLMDVSNGSRVPVTGRIQATLK